MPRAKNRVASRRRRKKILHAAKGYYGRKSRTFKDAKEAVQRSLRYQYRDRHNRKRDMRRLWIVRINAAARLQGVNYRNFICGLKKANVELDRKTIADLAVNDEATFKKLVEIAKANLN
jgi:large subunit ribosomal protein L20